VAKLQLFAIAASHTLGVQVAAALGVPLAAHEERDFEDGEFKIRPLESVRGGDVYVLHSLHGDTAQSANDKLMRLAVFIGALHDAAATRITAVTPYLCYARKDRRTKAHDPVSSRYVAQILEAVGCDCVLTFDVHNLAAYQNAFRIVAEHLEAGPLFAEFLGSTLGDAPLVVVSPDGGGITRAERFRQTLAARVRRDVTGAFMEKHRSAGVVSGTALVGDVDRRTAIVIDDLISTGGTLARAAVACRAHGATRVIAAATHGLFSAQADATIAALPVEMLIVTDTVPPFRLAPATRAKLAIVSVAPRLAAAIRALNAGDDLEVLQEPS